MKNRNFVNTNINPCKMCMPMGACIAFKGIEKAIVLMHGSQGCSTYVRRHMAQHYNEPVDIASSSLNEKATVFGGVDNLKSGLKNLIKLYNPKTVGIITTCLAETIGEDIDRILEEFVLEEGIDRDKLKLISVSTPGYGGSQFEGFYRAMKRTVESITKKSEKTKKLNIIAGNMSPAEIRHIKYILDLFEVEGVILPDISETLDAPYIKNKYKGLPDGGAKHSDIEKMGGSIASIELGALVTKENSAGKFLEDEFEVPLYRMPLPIGLKNTDLFINTIAKIYKKEIPKELKKARGRMLDAMIDSHKHNGFGKVAIFGDPELVLSLAKLCFENGILPSLISTGTDISNFKEQFKEELEKYGDELTILKDTDFETIQEIVREKEIDILLGHSDGKFVEEKEGVPLIRIGFPIHDRVGGQRQMNISYDGSLRLLDTITNKLLELKYSNYRETMYEKYYNGKV